MLPFFEVHFANPSGAYAASHHCAKAITTAREQVAALFGSKESEVVFTSGGTESDITALHAATHSFPDRKHIVTCATEHPAVLAPLETLALRQGYEITQLGVSAEGRIDLDELRENLRPGETALVSLMWANNETGVIQPVPEAAQIAHEAGSLFHTDSVQAAGKLPLNLSETEVDFAAISGHKLHAPKGTGALYIASGARYRPLFEGGGQESTRRAGTENVPGIVGLGAAAAQASSHFGDTALATLRDHFQAELLKIPDTHINGSQEHRTPNTISIRFDGTEAEGLLVLLDKQGICASAGSACHTGALKPSAVLTAMGLTYAQARATLRLSLSRFTTADEVETATSAITAGVEKLRSLRPSRGPVLVGQ